MADNFLGIPIDGEITRSTHRRNQRPIEEFEPTVRALLEDDQVVEFGWRQYTPYFNDGDECIFSGYGLWVRLTADAESPKDDEDEDDYENLELWGRDALRRGTVLGDKAWALESAINGGEFDSVLLELFGDHAEVKVRKDGISVNYYSHD